MMKTIIYYLIYATSYLSFEFIFYLYYVYLSYNNNLLYIMLLCGCMVLMM